MAANDLLYGHNARPVQPLNGRTIHYCQFPDSALSTPGRRMYPAPTCPSPPAAVVTRGVLPIRHNHVIKRPTAARVAARTTG